MDIELFLLKTFLNLKIERVKRYDEIECNKNIAYVFYNREEFENYFVKNGYTDIDEDMLKLCTFKTTKSNKIIALKGLCDHAIKERKEKEEAEKHKLLNRYLNRLDINNMPRFLKKYLEVPSLQRLKGISYFCGMDYASKNIYDFKEYITRYDHSLTTALLTYKLTNDKKATLAALFHDISTPCFSHVIDYMNGDYEKQESTEEYTEIIIRKDEKLLNLLKEDNIDIEDIIDFKQYSVVDNERPKLCADRVDGIILTGISWTKSVDEEMIDAIVNSLELYDNEDNEKEIGFDSIETAIEVKLINDEIDDYCHSDSDNYMMFLLSKIVKYSIRSGYISYNDLYNYSENKILEILKSINDSYLKEAFLKFERIRKENIPSFDVKSIKRRDINPLVNGTRLQKEQVKHI